MPALRVTGQFHFTDDQWRAIVEPLGCAMIDPHVKTQLEEIAAQFRRQNLNPLRYLSKEDKKVLAAVGKQAKLLREKLDHLENNHAFLRAALWTDVSVVIANDPDDEIVDEWIVFEKALESLIKTSERFAHEPRPERVNIPRARNRAWKAATEIFELVTGRRATATEPVDLGKGRKPPNGIFIQFIQAFWVAIGEREPRGDEIRGWQRRDYFKARPRPRHSMVSKT